MRCCPAHAADSKGKWELLHLPSVPMNSSTLDVRSLPLMCVPAAGNLEVCAAVGANRPSSAESLEGAVGRHRPPAAAAAALHPPRENGTKAEFQVNRKFVKKKSI